MARAIAEGAAAMMLAGLLAGAVPAEARGGRHAAFAGHHGHPINAWLGSRRVRLR